MTDSMRSATSCHMTLCWTWAGAAGQLWLTLLPFKFTITIITTFIINITITIISIIQILTHDFVHGLALPSAMYRQVYIP